MHAVNRCRSWKILSRFSNCFCSFVQIFFWMKSFMDS